MRFLTIFLSISLAASAAGAEALGTSPGAPAAPDETAPPEAAASEQPTEITLTTAAATSVTSVMFGAVTALSPAMTLASGGAVAISANNPFDVGADDADVATTETTNEASTEKVAATVASAPAAATVATSDDDSDADEPAQASEPTKIALPSKVPSEQDLRIQYQRVGRDLLKLQDQRGKFDCGGVIPRFKAIKLEQALATAASRTQLYLDLTDMALKIDRLRGIHIDAQCLQNPLASGCM